MRKACTAFISAGLLSLAFLTGCSHAEQLTQEKGKSGFIPMLMAGLTYGMTPCTPLLLMIGYCFTLPVHLAGMTGIAFSLSSMVSPVLLLVVVTGVLSKKMGRDMPYLFVKSWLPKTKINRTGTRSADNSANHVFFISFYLVQFCTSEKVYKGIMG